MQNKDEIYNNILNELTKLQTVDRQNANEIDLRLCELENKHRIIIKHFRNMLKELENNYAE